MANIYQLKHQIAALEHQNKLLEDEFEDYNCLKRELRQLVSAHLLRRSNDIKAINGAGLGPGRCVESFINKISAKLLDGTDKSSSSGASSIIDMALVRQRRIVQEMDNNKYQIRICKAKLREAENT